MSSFSSLSVSENRGEETKRKKKHICIALSFITRRHWVKHQKHSNIWATLNDKKKRKKRFYMCFCIIGKPYDKQKFIHLLPSAAVLCCCCRLSFKAPIYINVLERDSIISTWEWVRRKTKRTREKNECALMLCSSMK